MEEQEVQSSPRSGLPRRDEMKTPDDVSAMVRLKGLGWGAKRIAAELGCSKNTVKRWLRYGDWRPCVTPSRSKKLDGLSDWLAERFRRHRGNADVIRQELAQEKDIHVSLRTVERTVAPLRRELVAEARATVRFETPPGDATAPARPPTIYPGAASHGSRGRLRKGAPHSRRRAPVGRRQVVRQRFLVPPFGGSNPPAPASHTRRTRHFAPAALPATVSRVS